MSTKFRPTTDPTEGGDVLPVDDPRIEEDEEEEEEEEDVAIGAYEDEIYGKSQPHPYPFLPLL